MALRERNLRGYITVEKLAEADINGIHPVVVKKKSRADLLSVCFAVMSAEFVVKRHEDCAGNVDYQIIW
jgi:hypothetical protein